MDGNGNGGDREDRRRAESREYRVVRETGSGRDGRERAKGKIREVILIDKDDWAGSHGLYDLLWLFFNGMGRYCWD
jgi:hypothetical protein